LPNQNLFLLGVIDLTFTWHPPLATCQDQSFHQKEADTGLCSSLACRHSALTMVTVSGTLWWIRSHAMWIHLAESLPIVYFLDKLEIVQ